MVYKNEKQLRLVIRYTLPFLILILSLAITAFLFYTHNNDFQIIKKEVEERFISNQKQIIKNQVDNLYDYIISEQNTTEQKLRESLISRVNEAHKIVTNVYKQHQIQHVRSPTLTF